VSVSFRVTGAVYVFCVGLMLAAVLGWVSSDIIHCCRQFTLLECTECASFPV